MLTALTPATSRSQGQDTNVQKKGWLLRILTLFRISPWDLEKFSVRDLQDEMALDITYEELSNPLKNEIHPLLMRHHWIDKVKRNNSIWKSLDPVLKIASRFISEDAFLPFFYNLLFARKSLPYTSVDRLNHRLQSFAVDSSLTPEQCQQTQFYLQDLGFGNHRISFEFFTEQRTIRKPYGYSDSRIWINATSLEEKVMSKVCLNRTFLDTLYDHDNGIQRLTPCRLLRVRLKFAITIVHELVHSLDRLSTSNPIEPYFMDQQISELGSAWEGWMFGGRVFPFGHHFDIRAGLACQDWLGIYTGFVPKNWDKEVAASKRLGRQALSSNPLGDHAAPWRGPLVSSMVTWPVKMQYVLKVQKEDFWKGEFRSRGMEAIRMPNVYGKREYRCPRGNHTHEEVVRRVN